MKSYEWGIISFYVYVPEIGLIQYLLLDGELSKQEFTEMKTRYEKELNQFQLQSAEVNEMTTEYKKYL